MELGTKQERYNSSTEIIKNVFLYSSKMADKYVVVHYNVILNPKSIYLMDLLMGKNCLSSRHKNGCLIVGIVGISIQYFLYNIVNSAITKNIHQIESNINFHENET